MAVTAGGVIFAAWPLAYASAFSGFYFAMLLAFFALFLRPVGFSCVMWFESEQCLGTADDNQRA